MACQVGLGWSAAIGSGLVVARQEGGGWSPPSALSMYALGWGFQCGGALCDLLLVLHTKCALCRRPNSEGVEPCPPRTPVLGRAVSGSHLSMCSEPRACRCPRPASSRGAVQWTMLGPQPPATVSLAPAGLCSVQGSLAPVVFTAQVRVGGGSLNLLAGWLQALGASG